MCLQRSGVRSFIAIVSRRTNRDGKIAAVDVCKRDSGRNHGKPPAGGVRSTTSRLVHIETDRRSFRVALFDAQPSREEVAWLRYAAMKDLTPNLTPYQASRLARPIKPIRPEPNNHSAAGIGTGSSVAPAVIGVNDDDRV